MRREKEKVQYISVFTFRDLSRIQLRMSIHLPLMFLFQTDFRPEVFICECCVMFCLLAIVPTAIILIGISSHHIDLKKYSQIQRDFKLKKQIPLRKCPSYPLTFYGTQIINPFLSSMISANHNNFFYLFYRSIGRWLHHRIENKIPLVLLWFD